MVEFSSLIGPDAWAEFQECYRTKRFVARPEAVPERFRALWADWEFDAICRFTPLVEVDAFRMITRGKQIPEAAYRGRESGARGSIVRQLWDSGASINFARLELFSNPVLALVRGLEAAVGCPVRVHYFATPAKSQALAVHADHSDVLVLQVQGAKTWNFYPGSEHWPNDPGKVADEMRLHPPQSVTLETGGWLFLPKGVYHEARNAGDQASTHFTLGFIPLSWGHLVEDALGLARSEVPSLRETIALGESDEAVRTRVETQLNALQPFVMRALEAGRYGRRLPATELAPRAELEAASPAARFRWRSGVASSRTTTAGMEINLAYRLVPLTLRTELRPVIEEMMRPETFLSAELPEAPEVALTLCKFLVNVGILQLEAAVGCS